MCQTMQGCPDFLILEDSDNKSWSTAIPGGRVSIIAMNIVTWWHYTMLALIAIVMTKIN